MPGYEIRTDCSGPYSRFLVMKVTDSEQLVRYQIEQITRVQPAFLTPLFIRYSQGVCQVCQDITGMISLKDQIDQEELRQDQLIAILEEIEAHLLAAIDYLLPVNQFSLNPDMIFLSAENEVKLVFWPVRQADIASSTIEESLQTLGHHCGIEYQGRKNSSHQAGKKDEQTRKSGKKRNLPNLGFITTIPLPVLIMHLGLPLLLSLRFFWRSSISLLNAAGLIYIAALLFYDLSLLYRQLPGNFHDKIRTRVISLFRNLQVARFAGQEAANQHTAVIPDENEGFRVAMLSETATDADSQGIRAFILVAEFLVGRDMKKVDLHLPDSGIGRIHARIIRRSGSFFICDQGSKNGTYVDNKRLEKFSENLLPDECVIKFAHRSFNFQADSE